MSSWNNHLFVNKRNSMATDSHFYSEKEPFKKIALLFTIPCAILPVIMATAGLMSIPFAPLLFKYDFIVFGVLYLVYTYGLFLSWQMHRTWLPFSVFALHLATLVIYIFFVQVEWLGYVSVVSIMGTSICNQYFRVGSFECNECGACDANIKK
jgi:hypothetical protein